jgi:hypothetical protein
MRRIWRVLRWVLLALLCLAGGLVLLNSIDDRLDPGARAMLDAPVEELPRQQNLYYAVLGLGTTGDDPQQAGWERAQKALAGFRSGADQRQLAQDDGAELQFAGDRAQLPELGDLKGSLDFARQHPGEADRLLAENRRIVERYDSLQAYSRYVDPLPAAAGWPAVIPRWGLVGLGKRLRTLQMARDLTHDGPAAMVAWLRQDSRFWRRILAEEGTGLLGKMVMAAQLRDDFLIASQLLRLQALDATQLEALREVGAPLDEKERSLKGAWKSEFQWSAALLAQVFAEKPPAGADASWQDRLNFRLEKLFYLPNATLNRRYRRMLELMAIDGRDCVDFVAARDGILNAPNFTNAPWSLLRNPVGVVLSDISGPAYVDYPGRVCDLVGFQRLLALQILLRQGNPVDADIPAFIEAAGAGYADPYTGRPMRWIPGQKALSFYAQGKREAKLLPWPI